MTEEGAAVWMAAPFAARAERERELRGRKEEVTPDIQGDPSPYAKPPVDFNSKVPLWPGQARAGQAKMELYF